MKNKPPVPPGVKLTQEIPTDPSHKYTLLCLCCGSDTGETMNVRSSLADPVQLFGPDPANWKLRKGFCKSCEQKLKDGHTIYYSDTRGVILDFRGTHWHITEEQMDQVLQPQDAPKEKPKDPISD